MNAPPSPICLDNAAGTPLAPDLLAALPEIHRQWQGNPAAAHGLAADLRRRLQAMADECRRLLGIDPAASHWCWTSGGTEANALALAAHPGAVLASRAEHASLHDPLAGRAGAAFVPVRADGRLDLGALREALATRPALLCLHHVQNETGVTQDLVAVRRLLDDCAPTTRLHVDAVQSLGKLPIPWRQARLDSLSFSAHKLHGPAGIGALVSRYPVTRHGTVNAPGARAFFLAAQAALDARAARHAAVTALNRRLRAGLAGIHGLRLVSPPDASPWICSCCLPGYQGAVLVRLLSARGIHLGTGSACEAESPEPSRVLRAMGLTDAQARGALRISFGDQNTAADVEALLAALPEVLRAY